MSSSPPPYETVASTRLPGTSWGCKPARGPLEEPLSSRNQRWRDDERIDPRIRSVFKQFPFRVLSHDKVWIPALDSDLVAGGEPLAPAAGLQISEERIVSQPDGNEISLSVIRPVGDEGAVEYEGALAPSPARLRPCVVYCHGGGMSHYSAFLSCFQTLGRLIAARGVVCVLPDFRNSDVPSRAGEQAAPFPAGLNDCVSSVRWVRSHAAELGVDPGRVTVAGESGGGNLAIACALRLRGEAVEAGAAAAAGEAAQPALSGVFVACPFLRGMLDTTDERYPSYAENAGIFMDYPLDTAQPSRLYGHGEEEGRALHEQRNVEAWPGYLTEEDLSPERGGFPPCEIVLNEFDPLRDEGLAFYHTCVVAGVRARCTTLMGTTHGIGTYLPGICPDITRAVVDSIERLAKCAGDAGQ